MMPKFTEHMNDLRKHMNLVTEANLTIAEGTILYVLIFNMYGYWDFLGQDPEACGHVTVAMTTEKHKIKPLMKKALILLTDANIRGGEEGHADEEYYYEGNRDKIYAEAKPFFSVQQKQLNILDPNSLP